MEGKEQNNKSRMSNDELPMKSFVELKGTNFVIPSQQRGYKWTPANIKELLSDLWEFINAPSNKHIYCLQPLAVVPSKGKYSVLDGQQRLTTLFLLYKYLTNLDAYIFEFERDNGKDDKTINRWEFLHKISIPESEAKADDSIDSFYIYSAYKTIFTCFEERKVRTSIFHSNIELTPEEIKYKFLELLDGHSTKSIQVIWYDVTKGKEVNKEKQYEIFRNLNSGKIHLTNTDLIKALLLNRVSGLPQRDREEAAALFEQIEQQMENDHFWYMFNAGELREGQTRMDFLFNLVGGCTKRDYEIDTRWSFRNYFSKPEEGSLSDKWKQVRQTYLRLKDMYDDIYCYHYIGFLTYNSNYNTLNSTRNLLKLSRETKHSDFVKRLRDEIKRILNQKHTSVQDYTYYSDKKDLRLLFVMHNIETILQKYATLHDNDQLNLRNGFERFPFEILHKQNWDIEHIASNTDSDFKNPEDRDTWLKSIKADLGDKYRSYQVNQLEDQYVKTKKKDDFNKLYKAVMCRYDEGIEDVIKDQAGNGKDKMQVGNITLLDSHTNRSYHNALFPRKRRYIIVANGLTDTTNMFENGISKMYIPPCTFFVFTKAYNKDSNLSFNAWTQRDADAYVRDIEQKLSYYFI